MAGFAPDQVALGALIGFVPSLALFYLDGRRSRADRIRHQKMEAVDAAVGRLNMFLDQASAALVSTADAPVQGVLPHDALGYYTADLNLIPAPEEVKAFVILFTEVVAQRLHRNEARATQDQLMGLFVRIAASARKRREQLAKS